MREGDDAAKTGAAEALGDTARYNYDIKVLIAEAGGIPPLVELLRDGSAEAKAAAAWVLGNLAHEDAVEDAANEVLIAEAGGIPPLVELVRDGSAEGKQRAMRALGKLARYNAANKVLIAEAGGVPPFVELLRDGSSNANWWAATTLRQLADDNDANAVAIAVTVGLEALVELARSGDVTAGDRTVVCNAGLPAKRKAALVVAALLRDCVPGEKRSQVRDLIRAVIGPCL